MAPWNLLCQNACDSAVAPSPLPPSPRPLPTTSPLPLTLLSLPAFPALPLTALPPLVGPCFVLTPCLVCVLKLSADWSPGAADDWLTNDWIAEAATDSILRLAGVCGTEGGSEVAAVISLFPNCSANIPTCASPLIPFSGPLPLLASAGA